MTFDLVVKQASKQEKIKGSPDFQGVLDHFHEWGMKTILHCDTLIFLRVLGTLACNRTIGVFKARNLLISITVLKQWKKDTFWNLLFEAIRACRANRPLHYGCVVFWLVTWPPLSHYKCMTNLSIILCDHDDSGLSTYTLLWMVNGVSTDIHAIIEEFHRKQYLIIDTFQFKVV